MTCEEMQSQVLEERGLGIELVAQAEIEIFPYQRDLGKDKAIAKLRSSSRSTNSRGLRSAM